MNEANYKVMYYKLLADIDEAIASEYVELKQQGNILKGIEDLFLEIRFSNPELAVHIKNRMMEIAKCEDSIDTDCSFEDKQTNEDLEKTLKYEIYKYALKIMNNPDTNNMQEIAILPQLLKFVLSQASES